LTEAVDYVKTDLMPDFDFDAYNHDQVNEGENDSASFETPEISAPANNNNNVSSPAPEPAVKTSLPIINNDEEVDKW
jgi:hypothetical protein